MTAETTRPPLVPPQVDLRDFSFMPLDVRRLRDSDLSLVASGEEFKAAVLLWCAAWHQVPAASLPNDERWLARHSGAGPSWPKVKTEALRGFFLCSDGRLYHRIIAEKAMESWDRKLAQRERTRLATEARRKRLHERHDPRDVDRDEQRNGPRDEHRDVERDVHQGTGTGTVKGQGQGSEKQKHTRARKTPLPGGFAISERVRAWATEKGFDRLTEHLEAFVAKARAKGYEYADWDSAFMEAIREDWAGLRRVNGAGRANPNRQESLEERNLRVANGWTPPEEEAGERK